MRSVKKMLVRTPAFLDELRHWLAGDEHASLIGQLRQVCLQESGHNLDVLLSVRHVVSRGSEGFLLSLNDDAQISPKTCRFLLDHFRDNVQAVGYVCHQSDVRRRVRDNFVETIERHFLKPRFSFNEELQLLDQKFGNITIEYSERDETPFDLKFYTHTHNDRRYSEPLQFDDLVNFVLL